MRLQAKIGQVKDCEAALQRLRGESTNISEEAAEIRVTFKLFVAIHAFRQSIINNVHIQDYTQNLKQLPEGRFLDLFQRIYARSLMVTLTNRSYSCPGAMSWLSDHLLLDCLKL